MYRFGRQQNAIVTLCRIEGYTTMVILIKELVQYDLHNTVSNNMINNPNFNLSMQIFRVIY